MRHNGCNKNCLAASGLKQLVNTWRHQLCVFGRTELQATLFVPELFRFTISTNCPNLLHRGTDTDYLPLLPLLITAAIEGQRKRLRLLDQFIGNHLFEDSDLPTKNGKFRLSSITIFVSNFASSHIQYFFYSSCVFFLQILQFWHYESVIFVRNVCSYTSFPQPLEQIKPNSKRWYPSTSF